MHSMIAFTARMARLHTPDRLKIALGRGWPYEPAHDALEAVFIRLPKTGSSSMSAVLGTSDEFHRRAATFRRYDPERWRRYFTFGVVRNPFDRLLSAWRWALDPRTGRHDGLTAAVARVGPDFPAFVRHAGRYRWPLAVPIFAPQHHFLAERRGLIVDYVGRFERLDEDFATICERLSLDTPSLPHLNRRRAAGGYRDHFDAETRAIVERLYARDLALFGYRF